MVLGINLWKREEQSHDLEAAGRTLSNQNMKLLADALKAIGQAVQSIERVLTAAGVMPASDDKEELKSSAFVEAAANGSFAEQVASRSWYSRFGIVLQTFTHQFREMATCSLEDMQKYLSLPIKSEEDRKSALEDLISEFAEVLQELSEAYPVLGDNAAPYRFEYGDSEMDMEMYCAKGDVQAGMLRNRISYQTWSSELQIILKTLSSHFVRLHTRPILTLQGIDNEEERQAAIAKVIADGQEFLVDCISKAKQVRSKEALSASSLQEAPSVEDDDADDDSGFSEGEVIEASMSLDTSMMLSSEISASSAGVEIHVEAGSNLYPVTGTLFRIDEASESPPSVGPGLPLYVPRHVAEKCLNVSNLPLEAASSLKEHDKAGTCGVMSSASLTGNDFAVQGYLWNYNHSEKVQAILAAKEELGMSMNARAEGRVKTVAGTKVFWIEELELLGGCILLADSATYRKTRFQEAIAAASQPESTWKTLDGESDLFAIAAGAFDDDNPNPTLTDETTGEDPMPVPAEIQAMNNALDALTATLTKISGSIGNLEDQVSTLMSERDNEIAAARKQEVEAAQQQSTQSLVETISASLKTTISEAVRSEVERARNPHRVPPRLTAPVVQAAATTAEAPESELVKQYISAKGALETLRANNADRVTRLKLSQQIAELETQLRNEGSPIPTV